MNLKFTPGLIILLLLVTIPIFGHLDELPIQLWDESRLMQNALEMNHDGNYIVTHYQGQPEMWNTKPPFLIWLQVLCIKLVGMNTLALRLPSALAALATCLLMYWLLGKKFKKPWLGLLSCMVLICTPGYVMMHSIRTGDYDSLLTLLLTACTIYYYLYLEEGKGKYLSLAIGSLILACLTKGVAGLLILPTLFLYTLYKRKMLVLFTNKRLYIGLGGFIVLVIGYYLLREHYNPGYIKAVQNNELGGRYAEMNEGHWGSSYFYLNLITDQQFRNWYLLVIPGVFLGIAATEKWLKNLTVLLLLFAGSFLYIISNASTKLLWYSVPVYPALAIIVAVFIYGASQILMKVEIQDHFNYNPLPYALMAFLFVVPYCAVISFTILDPPNPQPFDVHNEEMAKYLKDVLDGSKNIDNCTVADSHPQNIICYKTIFEYKHKPVLFIGGHNFKNAKKVVAYTDGTKMYIDSNYYNHVLRSTGSVVVYEIDSVKTRPVSAQ